MVGTLSGIGAPAANLLQPYPWGTSPYSQSPLPQQAIQLLQILPQQLQTLQQLQYVQQQQLQQLQQQLLWIPQQLQQAVHQIASVIPQQLQSFLLSLQPGSQSALGLTQPGLGNPFQTASLGHSFFPAHAGHVM